MTLRMIPGALVCAAAVAMATSLTGAQEREQRTLITFSEPVIVPGATLAPGEYQFELADPDSGRVVRIRNAETREVMASVSVVPAHRVEAEDDTVLTFNPTERGAPVAIKAWFYQGRRIGHEFIYSDEQARHIAERAKTIVLSMDTSEPGVERGTLRVYDASGTARPYTPDPETERVWQEDRAERSEASAPIVVGAATDATKVAFDDVEDAPAEYFGQRISVDAEVEEVLGPRLFTIEEPNWDLDGEIMVLVRSPLAAFVKDDDRITVTGTVRPFVEAEVEREWGWLGLTDEVEVDLSDRAVIVADHIVGGNDDVALLLDVSQAGASPVGTAGHGASAPISSLDELAGAGAGMVGRMVDLDNAMVSSVAQDGGFFVGSGDQSIYVRPSTQQTVREGDRVSIDGIVLRMPRGMNGRLDSSGGMSADVYVYALDVRG